MNQNQAEMVLLNNELKQGILHWTPSTGRLPTAIPGFMVIRRENANEPQIFFNQPMVGITAQGRKRSIIAGQEYQYGEGHCVIAGIDMPSVSYLTEASPDRPYLAVSIDLNRRLAAEIISELEGQVKSKIGFAMAGIAVTEVDLKVLKAAIRLIELLDEPQEIPIIAPMLIKEIHFRLLQGPQGEWLRAMYTLGTRANQIAESVTWLRNNFKETLEVQWLAKHVSMSLSTFHRHFKEITNLSPLQFQKQLRLHEAQHLMLFQDYDVSNAAYAVGYESATQFIREYKREFGEPPLRDVNRLKSRDQLGTQIL